MKGIWGGLGRTRSHAWSFWKFNWIVNHRILGALRRTRRYARGVLLDVGCGDKAFAHGVGDGVERYLGIDLPGSHYRVGPDVYGRAEALPFRAASFDTVLGLSVMNYLADPLAMLIEARRVLKADGYLVLEFPEMVALYAEPLDFFRFTRYGAESLLARAGFETVEVVVIGGLWTAVGLQLLAVLNRINRGPWRIVTELPVRILYVIVQLVFAALDRLFFAPRWTLAHLVVARPARSRTED